MSSKLTRLKTNKLFTVSSKYKIKEQFVGNAIGFSVIRFRQGFGRLIRTTYDEGIFIVMDDRIVNKRYGTAFSDVVPVDLKRFSNLEDLR